MATGPHELKVLVGGRASGGAAPGPAGGKPIGPDAARLHELYSQFGGSVYGRCRYLLRDPAKAEDAMQDVFAKALVNVSGFRAEASPLTWLTKIATNHCLNLLRSERAPWHQTYEDQELGRADRAQRHGPAEGPELFENREAVRQLLVGVDIETQAAAIHYYVDEMTLEEVAASLGRSVPTVRKRLAAFAAKGAARQESARQAGGHDD
jgi:RNA polymerase sigma-70 factor (ECF subfamily)